MRQFRYIGSDPSLVGETAIGQMVDGVFKVQVDRFDHPWSHFWHETPKGDWVVIP
jgi:hypothetical protein